MNLRLGESRLQRRSCVLLALLLVLAETTLLLRGQWLGAVAAIPAALLLLGQCAHNVAAGAHLTCSAAGWKLVDARGRDAIPLPAEASMQRYVIVLPCRWQGGKRRPLLILADMLSRAEWSQLRRQLTLAARG